MTLRQVWVRIKALPYDSPLWIEWRAAEEKREAEERVSEIEDVLAPYSRRPPEEG